MGQSEVEQLLCSLHAANKPCKCRIHPEAAQEWLNNATLMRHVCSLDIDPTRMCVVFAILKTGSNAVKPQHFLRWDDEEKVWWSNNKT